jgi:hypothetical protein
MRLRSTVWAWAIAALAACSNDGDDPTDAAGTKNDGGAASSGVGAAAGAGGSAAGSGTTGGAGGGAATTTSAGGTGGSARFACDVCQLTDFVCETPSGPLGTATITMPTDTGCSGFISAGDETAQLWIHCDTATICVEHVDECFDASTTATSFAYNIPDKYVITCTES